VASNQVEGMPGRAEWSEFALSGERLKGSRNVIYGVVAGELLATIQHNS